MRLNRIILITSIVILCSHISAVDANADFLKNTFASAKYHYSIRYPSQWIAHDKGGGVVVFNDKLAKQFYTVVNIQTIYTKKAGGHYASVKNLMDDFVSQVPQHTARSKFFERKSITFTQPNGYTMQGESITFTFYENGRQFKQWQVMFMSKDGNLFQAWAYRSPIDFYDTNLSLASAMLSTWVMT